MFECPHRTDAGHRCGGQGHCPRALKHGGVEDCMRTARRMLCAGLLAVGTLILAACPGRVAINKIKIDPGRFVGRDVTIAGRVTNSFGAMGSGVFEVDDGTGSMWVFSDHYGIPGSDARLAVTGRIEEGFTFGGRHFVVVLRETERRH